MDARNETPLFNAMRTFGRNEGVRRMQRLSFAAAKEGELPEEETVFLVAIRTISKVGVPPHPDGEMSAAEEALWKQDCEVALQKLPAEQQQTILNLAAELKDA